MIAQDNKPTKKPIVITWKLAIVVVGSVIVLGFCCCSGVLFMVLNDLDTSVSEADFATNQERIDHINGVLPITLPNSVTVVRFHLEGFQDWFLDFEGTIPAADIDAFISTLPPLDEDEPDHFKEQVGPDYIDIQIDRDAETIRIEFFET